MQELVEHLLAVERGLELAREAWNRFLLKSFCTCLGDVKGT